MKYIIFSDGHIGEYTEGWIDPTTKLNTRLLDTLSVWDWVLQLAQTEKADGIIFGGDRFRLRRPPFWMRDLADAKIRAISDAGIALYLLVGNHDMYDKAGTWDSYNGLRVWNAPVHILNEPTIRTVGDDIHFAFLPYGYTAEDIQKLEAQLDVGRKVWSTHVLFFHDDVRGSSQYGNGFVAPNGLPKIAFESGTWDLVVGGHVHLRQELPFETTIGFHVGSPLDRVEDGPQGAKGAWILDVCRGDDKIKIQFVPSPFPKVVRSGYPSDTWAVFLNTAKDNIAVVNASVPLGENRIKLRRQILDELHKAGSRSASVTVSAVQTLQVNANIQVSLDTQLPLGRQLIEWARQKEIDPQVVEQLADVVGDD